MSDTMADREALDNSGAANSKAREATYKKFKSVVCNQTEKQRQMIRYSSN